MIFSLGEVMAAGAIICNKLEVTSDNINRPSEHDSLVH
jgi:hypothetical protein